MPTKIISIVGATGAQGGSVVDALLKNPSYTVRAITRNTQSDSGKALAAKGAQVVAADANDLASLTAAFEGSYAVFAVTNFFEPFARFNLDAAKAMETEVQQGVNLAKAASATSTLKHFIWSTLPNAHKISGGKHLVPHFQAKNTINDYIRSDKALLPKTTFLWVGFYASNLDFPMYTPYYIPTAQKYIQIQCSPADTNVATIGDVRVNVGIFVESILEQPQKTLAADGKFVFAYTEITTAGEFLQAWGDANGHNVQYVQVDRNTFHKIWPGWAEEMGSMTEFWEEAGDKSWSGEEGIVTGKDLGVKNLVGLKEAFVGAKY